MGKYWIKMIKITDLRVHVQCSENGKLILKKFNEKIPYLLKRNVAYQVRTVTKPAFVYVFYSSRFAIAFFFKRNR